MSDFQTCSLNRPTEAADGADRDKCDAEASAAIQPLATQWRAFASSLLGKETLDHAGAFDGDAVAAPAHLCWNVKLAMEFAARAHPGKLPSSLTADNSSQS